jgi:hypothetical protein
MDTSKTQFPVLMLSDNYWRKWFILINIMKRKSLIISNMKRYVNMSREVKSYTRKVFIVRVV